MGTFPRDPASVTAPWLSEVLGAQVRGCRLEQIGIGVGLLGRLFRVHLNAGPEVPTSVVVKLPMLDTTVRTALCEDLELYRSEVGFYQEIGLADPLRPARPYFAAFDETTHDFVLVLEDLGRLRLADQTQGCSAADAAIVTALDVWAELPPGSFGLAPRPYTFATRSDNLRLANEIDAALQAMERDGSLDAILRRWLAARR